MVTNKYDPTLKKDDPIISIKVPAKILRDLVCRSQENGNTVELELAKRLARTLERDLDMIETDNQLAFLAFSVIQNNPEFASKVFSELKNKKTMKN